MNKEKKNRRKYRLFGSLLLICMIFLVCGIAFAGTREKSVKITIKADDFIMIQDMEIPVFTAKVELKGREKVILDTKSKFNVKDLMQELESGKGYSLLCESDGKTEGEYPVKVILDSDIEKVLEEDWKGRVTIETVDAVLTVENKYGSWEGTKFRRTDGNYVTNDFIVSNGHTFYFDADGNMAVGWQEIDGLKYHFNEKGIMTTGWFEENGNKYYFDADGRAYTGWYEENGAEYYFHNDGRMAVGKVKLGITAYTFDESGVLAGEEKDIDPTKPMIALTFDDGPGEKTMDLLNALEQYKVHATFFMCGNSLSRTDIDVDAILKKMDEIGCDTSNHTMTHPSLDKLTPEQIVSEVQGVSNIIAGYTGHGAAALRPPYGRGIHNDTVIQNVGLPMIYWSIDTMDWKTKSKEATVQAVMEQARDGSIVLMHDIHEWSVEAAIEVIPKLIDAGYQIVTISELAAARGVTLEPGITYFNFYPES